VAALIGTLIVAAPASAQTAAPASDWTHGTMVDLFGGAVTAPSADLRAAIGAGFGWEINHWVKVEGTGTWIAATQGDSAFAAEMAAAVNVTRPNTLVPFVSAGIGLYRATFDTTAGPLPDFYQRGETATSPAVQTFTDPSFIFGAGVNVFTGQHISIRPDVSVRLVYSDSQTYAVTMVTVHLTYHFEVHTVSGTHRASRREATARE
jgi:hypothetical protein